MIRVLLLTAYFSYRGLFRWLSPTTYISLKIVLPLAQLSFFALIGAAGRRLTLDEYLIGNAMAVATISGIYSVATAVTDERRNGTLIYLMASPSPKAPIFYGRSLFHIADGSLTVVIGFIWAVLAFGLELPVGSWLALLIVIAVGTLASAGMGLLVGVAAYLFIDVSFLANTAVFLVLLLSGSNVPLADLPGFAAAAAQFVPLTRSIEAARMLATGAEPATVASLVLADAVLGFAYASLGFIVFRWAERRARRDGNLEGI